jgi:uncharacterized membrane protein
MMARRTQPLTIEYRTHVKETFDAQRLWRVVFLLWLASTKIQTDIMTTQRLFAILIICLVASSMMTGSLIVGQSAWSRLLFGGHDDAAARVIVILAASFLTGFIATRLIQSVRVRDMIIITTRIARKLNTK